MDNGIIDRERKVNVKNINDDQLELLIAEISKKITKMVDSVCDKANRMLNVYGLQAKMQIAIQPIEKDKE